MLPDYIDRYRDIDVCIIDVLKIGIDIFDV